MYNYKLIRQKLEKIGVKFGKIEKRSTARKKIGRKLLQEMMLIFGIHSIFSLFGAIKIYIPAF